MNTSTHRYGFHNRKPYVSHYGDFGISSTTGEVIESRIPFVMAQECQFTKTTLGQSDKGYTDCKWKEIT